MSFEFIDDCTIQKEEDILQKKKRVYKKKELLKENEIIKDLKIPKKTIKIKYPKAEKPPSSTAVKKMEKLLKEKELEYQKNFCYEEWKEDIERFTKTKLIKSENDDSFNKFIKSNDVQKCIKNRAGHLINKIDETDYLSLGLKALILYFEDFNPNEILDTMGLRVNFWKKMTPKNNTINLEKAKEQLEYKKSNIDNEATQFKND